MIGSRLLGHAPYAPSHGHGANLRHHRTRCTAVAQCIVTCVRQREPRRTKADTVAQKDRRA